MAMNSATLSADIKARLIANCSATDDALLQAWCDEIAAAVVSHIISNAVISTTVTVTSVSGVTVGAGASGPGTGTGTGTIS